MDGGRTNGVEVARPGAERRAPLGRVVHAQLAVQGPLEPTAAAQVMATRLAALRACYRISPASHGASEGRVDLRLAVAADRRVTHLAASQSGASPPEVVACMTASLAELAFPASPRGPSAVSYPLLLVPAAGAPPTLTTIPMAPALKRQPWSSPCGASRRAHGASAIEHGHPGGVALRLQRVAGGACCREYRDRTGYFGSGGSEPDVVDVQGSELVRGQRDV
ncbi:MAG: hypothetical protein JW751_02730 [Polyangiaceae bacterium]|nr:hypothetical protein [Polyangiaceae bacterium]